jgi:hypothetical protein
LPQLIDSCRYPSEASNYNPANIIESAAVIPGKEEAHWDQLQAFGQLTMSHFSFFL